MDKVTVVVAVITSVSHGCERGDAGWYFRGTRSGQWVEEKIHSIHDHPKKARKMIAHLTPVTHTELADPSNPQSPVGFSQETTYCIRELCVGMDWPRGDSTG